MELINDIYDRKKTEIISINVEWDCVAAVKRHPVLHYSVYDFFLSFHCGTLKPLEGY